MIVRDILDESFQDYKKPAMYIAMPFCDFKCCSKAKNFCQNAKLLDQPTIEVHPKDLVDRYLRNKITSAVVFSGMEPMLSFGEVVEFISELRKVCGDDVVIYTGYNKDECDTKIDILKRFSNIVVKFGRYAPKQKTRFDEILGVELASDNQHAEKIC